MNIGDILGRLMGKPSPEDIIAASAQGGQPQPQPNVDPNATGSVPPPPPGGGMVLPAQGPQAQAYQSPPDLANMYMKIMESNNRANMRSEGMTMLAAGLTPRDETRAALLNTIGKNQKSGITMDNILAMQKAQQEQDDKLRQRAMLPGLAKQYGLDDATLQYLDATGQLDEVVAKLADPTTEVVEKADGSKILINKRDGSTIHELSPAKARETGYVKQGDGSQVLVYMDTKEPVAGGKPLTDIAAPPREIIQVPNPDGKGGTISVYKDTMEPVGGGDAITKTEAPPRKIVEIDDPEGKGGKIAVYEDDRTPVDKEKYGTKSIGSTPKQAGNITVETLANGKKQAFQDGNPVGEPIGPETDVSPADVKTWNNVNADNKARGLPEVGLNEWLLSQKKAGATQVNIGPDGIDYGKAPEDMVWLRDKDGKVKLDANGKPMADYVTNSPKDLERKKKEQEAADAAAAGEKTEAGKVVTRAVVNQDIGRAIEIVDKNKNSWLPATGWGAFINSIPGTDALDLKNAVNTVKANVTVEKLNQLRSESKTGASGLGQVTENENRMLQATMGSLEQSQDADDLKYNLRRIDALQNAIVNGIPDGKGGVRPVQTQADMDAIFAAIPKDTAEAKPKGRHGLVIVERPGGQ